MAFQAYKRTKNERASEKGSALVYILIAIALLAALTVSFMEPSSQQTSSQSTFRSVAALQGQIDTIRSAVQECVLVYPNGDNCIDGSNDITHCDGDSADAPGAKKSYPLDPNSVFYDNATPDQQTNIVANLRCPGNNPGATADHDNHVAIFGGTTGKFMQPAPDLFEDWQYYNGTDGVYFWIETTKGDAFLTSALNKLDAKFSTCEADVIDASGGAEDLDSNAETACTLGSTCFRVWMIDNGTAPHAEFTASGCGASQI